MLVVTIEKWPHGDSSRAESVGRIDIINDQKGTHEWGNYEAIIQTRDADEIRGHVVRIPRTNNARSVWWLLWRVLAELLPGGT